MTEAKEGEMYCAVEGCGLVDETHSAHCIKHGRSTHKIKGEDKIYAQESQATPQMPKGQSSESKLPAKPETLPANALVDIYADQQNITLNKQKEEK